MKKFTFLHSKKVKVTPAKGATQKEPYDGIKYASTEVEAKDIFDAVKKLDPKKVGDVYGLSVE